MDRVERPSNILCDNMLPLSRLSKYGVTKVLWFNDLMPPNFFSGDPIWDREDNRFIWTE